MMYIILLLVDTDTGTGTGTGTVDKVEYRLNHFWWIFSKGPSHEMDLAFEDMHGQF